MTVRFLSVCSGIEAASVAWHPLGWTPLAFAEIEDFPSAVLAHHYPTVPNLGDITKWPTWPEELLVEVDLLVGGTPCQSFSVAGLRRGLHDERGNIMLRFLELANAIDDLRRDHGRPPIWILWENVPGVFSDKTNGFGALLGGLCGSDAAVPRPSGGGWPDAGVAAGPQRTAAWRVLDSQYFGVAQRRRRVFVLALGGAGAWACADALLPIGESVSRHPPPRREARQGVAGSLAARTRGGGGLGTDFECGGGPVPQTVGALTDGAHNGEGLTDRTPTPGASLPSLAMCLNAGAMGRQDAESETLIPTIGGGFDVAACEVADSLTVGVNQTTGFIGDVVAHSLRGEGFDASEDGTGRGTPLVPIVAPTLDQRAGRSGANSFATSGGLVPVAQPYSIMPMNSGRDYKARPTDIAQPIMAGGPVGGNQGGDVVVQAVAFAQNTRDEVRLQGGDGQIVGALAAEPGMKRTTYVAFHCTQDPISSEEVCHALGTGSSEGCATAAVAIRTAQTSANGHGIAHDVAHTLDQAQGQAVAVDCYNHKIDGDVAATFGANSGTGNHAGPAVMQSMQVRRLTPVECARLQGFPDDYLDIIYRGKPAADGPKYRALGNSMAVPVMRYIGKRVMEASKK